MIKIVPDKIVLDFPFTSHAPAGTIFHHIPDTYGPAVCDCCGMKKKCDYWKTDDTDIWDCVFLDLCRTCLKEHAEAKE